MSSTRYPKGISCRATLKRRKIHAEFSSLIVFFIFFVFAGFVGNISLQNERCQNEQTKQEKHIGIANIIELAKTTDTCTAHTNTHTHTRTYAGT